MPDRITTYRGGKPAKQNDRLDEIVATGTDVHLEMLHENFAYLRVGSDVFQIFGVKRGRRRHLIVRYFDRET